MVVSLFQEHWCGYSPLVFNIDDIKSRLLRICQLDVNKLDLYLVSDGNKKRSTLLIYYWIIKGNKAHKKSNLQKNEDNDVYAHGYYMWCTDF